VLTGWKIISAEPDELEDPQKLAGQRFQQFFHFSFDIGMTRLRLGTAHFGNFLLCSPSHDAANATMMSQQGEHREVSSPGPAVGQTLESEGISQTRTPIKKADPFSGGA
jgi:hypothetical protein